MQLLPGYELWQGSSLDRSLLVKFMQLTYQEWYPQQDFSHLSLTVEHYYSSQTPLWWVVEADQTGYPSLLDQVQNPIACLWLGNAVDQVTGDRHGHIFLLYVQREYRRQGIGRALMQYAIGWAKQRGDRQLGLQVFHINEPAIALYSQLGFKPLSLWMIKRLDESEKT